MKLIKLNDSTAIPIIGFGTYFPNMVDTEESVYEALKCGYRMLDTARWYQNEDRVSIAIKRSGIKREELFITCKVMCSSFEEVIKNVLESLKTFDTTYFDLILIHWPDQNMLDTYRALEELYNRGQAKAIGISNFNERQCEILLRLCKVKPVINQIETNIYFQEDKMHNYLKSVDIKHESWAPFCEGYNNMLNDQVLLEIADKYHKSVAQIVLRYFIEDDIIVIPKSSNSSHIKENLEIFDFSLEKEDREKIHNLDKKTMYSGWPQNMSEETIY